MRSSTVRLLLFTAWVVLVGLPVHAARADDGQANAKGEQPRLVAQLGHSFPIVTMAVSPDGKLLGTGADDGWMIVWDAATLNELCRLRDSAPDAIGKTVEEIQFSPDSRFVAARCGALLDQSVNHVWEIATGREIHFNTEEGEVRSSGPLRFSPDAKRCVAVARDKIWFCPLDAKQHCRNFLDEDNHYQISRPLVLRTSFHDEDQLDPLGLSEQLDELLRDMASAPHGQHPPLAFADARQLPGAYHVAGRYQINGHRVNVSVHLAPPEGKGVQFSVEGDKAKVPELAAKICDAVQQRLTPAKSTT